MTEQEKYLFDLQGYITVPGALNSDELAQINALVDEHIARDAKPGMQTHRFGRLLSWSKVIRDVIDNARIAPYLEALLGKQFRLDHDYLDVIRGGLSPVGATLHGGGSPFDPSQYYHYRNGQMYNGLSVVAYNLKDVNPGDGGFGCVPGSHKANFPYPQEWKNMEDPARMHPSIRAVTGPAGTAVIFTEALTHGALPWRGKDERRTLFFKYSPHPIAWSAQYYNAADYEGLTPRQIEVLEPPNARYKGRNPYAK